MYALIIKDKYVNLVMFRYELFFLQIHVLSDATRGATMEAVVSRMKTIQAAMNRLPGDSGHVTPRLRFVAVSATIPNISDVGNLNLVMKSCFIHRITFNCCNFV